MTREGWIRLAVIVAAVALLEALCRTGVIAHTVLLAPSEMAVSLWNILRGASSTTTS